jgi:hypothetical protein
MTTDWQEVLTEKQVTCTLNLNGQIILIENVPARVNEETGEQFFSPATVERLQQTTLDSKEPDHCNFSITAGKPADVELGRGLPREQRSGLTKE